LNRKKLVAASAVLTLARIVNFANDAAPFCENLANLYYGLYIWDVVQFSQPWLYWWLLIPAMFFTIFFILKWTLLTLPLALIVSALRRSR
jgi:hypothetical protein